MISIPSALASRIPETTIAPRPATGTPFPARGQLSGMIGRPVRTASTGAPVPAAPGLDVGGTAPGDTGVVSGSRAPPQAPPATAARAARMKRGNLCILSRERDIGPPSTALRRRRRAFVYGRTLSIIAGSYGSAFVRQPGNE